MVFCNFGACDAILTDSDVTILILIDGFLQLTNYKNKTAFIKRHNPYFNRWFSAISIQPLQKNNVRGVTILILIDGFLQ